MSGRTQQFTLRASAVLTNAFVTSPAINVPAGVASGSFGITYTRGAAGGYPSIIVEQSDDGFTTAESLAIFSGTITQSNEQGATNALVWVWTPFGTTGPSSGAAVSIAVGSCISPRCQMRVRCEETGQKGTPGTLGVTFVGWTS